RFLSAGIRVLGVVGPQGGYASDGLPSSEGGGYQAWAALPALRLHSVGTRVQFFCSAGGGGGQLIHVDCACNETAPLSSPIAPFVQVGLGMRVLVRDFTFGLGVDMQLWTKVSPKTLPFSFPNPNPGPTLTSASLSLQVGWRGLSI